MVAKHYGRNISLQTLREKTQIGKAGVNNYFRNQLVADKQWTEETKIAFTPTIFINGYEIPKQYRPDDLKIIIRNMENISEVKETVEIENNYAPV